jgi:molybdate transport system regulatory protein
MKISARNVFSGQLTSVQKGAVNAEVEVALPGGDALVAIVTNASCDALGLTAGKDVLALVKASSVLIMAKDASIKLSARNQLTGTVSKVIRGAVNTEVSIKLAGGNEVNAIITHGSEESLRLKPGQAATAVIKASSVILGVAD